MLALQPFYDILRWVGAICKGVVQFLGRDCRLHSRWVSRWAIVISQGATRVWSFSVLRRRWTIKKTF